MTKYTCNSIKWYQSYMYMYMYLTNYFHIYTLKVIYLKEQKCYFVLAFFFFRFLKIAITFTSLHQRSFGIRIAYGIKNKWFSLSFPHVIAYYINVYFICNRLDIPPLHVSWHPSSLSVLYVRDMRTYQRVLSLYFFWRCLKNVFNIYLFLQVILIPNCDPFLIPDSHDFRKWFIPT